MPSRPLTLRCREGCHLASCGFDVTRQLVIAGRRTMVYAGDADGHPERARGDFLGTVGPGESHVFVGCSHWPSLRVPAELLLGWTAQAARGGRKLRIVTDEYARN